MDGRIVAAQVKKEVAVRVRELEQHGIIPYLSTVLVGDDPASASYLKSKHRACEEVRIRSENHRLPVHTTQKELENLIAKLNVDSKVNGILVQLRSEEHTSELK